MEAAKDRRNSAERLILASETSVLVTEVPMLAPMIMGMALATVRALLPTSPTTMEVVLEELWTTEVDRMPMKRPTMGFEVPAIKASAKPFPNSFIELPMRSMLRRKR